MSAISCRLTMRPLQKRAVCKGIRVERPQDIARAIKQALAADASVLIDVVADPNAMPPVSAFASLPNY